MAEKRRLPIGRQSFVELREQGFLYIDKTEYVYRMTHTNAKYIFLSRPRRFGKTLLTNTLHAYFEGKKELFEGLAIEAGTRVDPISRHPPRLERRQTDGEGALGTLFAQYLGRQRETTEDHAQ